MAQSTTGRRSFKDDGAKKYSDQQKDLMRRANPVPVVAERLGLDIRRGDRINCLWHSNADGYNAKLLEHSVYCHSNCGKVAGYKGKDVFELVMAAQNWNFKQAADWLASYTPGVSTPAGVIPAMRTPASALPVATSRIATLERLPDDEQDVQDIAVDWWHETLLKTPEIVSYLAGRLGADMKDPFQREAVLAFIARERLGYSNGTLAGVLQTPAKRAAAVKRGILTEDGRESMAGRVLIHEHRTYDDERHAVFTIGRPPREIPAPQKKKVIKYLCTKGPRPLMGAETQAKYTMIIESQFDRLLLLFWGYDCACNGMARPGPLVVAETRALLTRTRGIFIPNMDEVGILGMKNFIAELELGPAQRPLWLELREPVTREPINDVGVLATYLNTDKERDGLEVFRACLKSTTVLSS